MVNGALFMFLDPCDFIFERCDARVQLGNRQRIEILLHDERERIAGARQVLFEIHERQR